MTPPKLTTNKTSIAIFVGTMLTTFVGSGGSVFIYMKTMSPEQLQTIARPDPATGAELRRLEIAFRRHIEEHPDHELRTQIKVLETKINILLDRTK